MFQLVNRFLSYIFKVGLPIQNPGTDWQSSAPDYFSSSTAHNRNTFIHQKLRRIMESSKTLIRQYLKPKHHLPKTYFHGIGGQKNIISSTQWRFNTFCKLCELFSRIYWSHLERSGWIGKDLWANKVLALQGIWSTFWCGIGKAWLWGVWHCDVLNICKRRWAMMPNLYTAGYYTMLIFFSEEIDSIMARGLRFDISVQFGEAETIWLKKHW